MPRNTVYILSSYLWTFYQLSIQAIRCSSQSRLTPLFYHSSLPRLRRKICSTRTKVSLTTFSVNKKICSEKTTNAKVPAPLPANSQEKNRVSRKRHSAYNNPPHRPGKPEYQRSRSQRLHDQMVLSPAPYRLLSCRRGAYLGDVHVPLV
jgi:hypothetical protein